MYVWGNKVRERKTWLSEGCMKDIYDRPDLIKDWNCGEPLKNGIYSNDLPSEDSKLRICGRMILLLSLYGCDFLVFDFVWRDKSPSIKKQVKR